MQIPAQGRAIDQKGTTLKSVRNGMKITWCVLPMAVPASEMPLW